MASPGEITSTIPPAVGWKNLLSTRRGTMTLAALAALAALGVLLLFMSNYRQSVAAGAADVRVLVADQTLDKGTSGDAIAEAGLFRPVTLSDAEAVEGGVTDPSAIAGQVLARPIYEGQQLTAAAFVPGADPVAGKLEGLQRAIAVPVDAARGNIGQVEAGSRVDVLGSISATQTGGRATSAVDVLARNILVLRAPNEASAGPGQADDGAVVLRVTDKEASRIAYATDAGDIWLTVRPPTLGKDSKAGAVNYESSAGMLSLLEGLGG